MTRIPPLPAMGGPTPSTPMIPVTPVAAIQARVAAAMAEAVDAMMAPSGVEAAVPAKPAPRTREEVQVRAVSEAVKTATGQAAARQGGLAPLMADLERAVASPAVPSSVRAAAREVLNMRTPLTPDLKSADVREAVSRSGLFLEARLAARPALSPGAPPAPPPADLKAALLVFRQVVSAWSEATPPAAPSLPQPFERAPTATTAAAPPGPAAAVEHDGETAVAHPIFDAQPEPPEPGAAKTALPPGSPHASPVRPGPAGITRASGELVAEAGFGAEPTPDPDPSAPNPARTQLSAPTPSRPSAMTPKPGAAAPAPEAEPQAPAAAAPPQAEADAKLARAAPAGARQLPAAYRAAALTVPAELPPEVTGEEPERSGPPFAEGRPAGASPREPNDPPRIPPPPFRGGALRGEAPAAPSLPGEAEPGSVARRLTQETQGALARQELLQIASLPEAGPGVKATDASRWMFELPFTTPQGTATAQFEISRDGSGGSYAAVEAPTWRARFSLDFEPMGPVHAEIAMRREGSRVSLWAERPGTAARLRAGQGGLRRSLEGEDHSAEVMVFAGAPGGAAPTAGRFVDQAS